MAISVIGGAAASSGKVQKTEFIKSTQSWTAPAGVTSVEVILVAGGGSGIYANYNTMAGGGGSVLHSVLTVSPGTAYTVTIGAGGASSNTYDYGNDGSASSFGALLTCPGGNQGNTGGVTAGKGLGGNADWLGGKQGYLGYGAGGGGKSTSGTGGQPTAGGNGAGNGANFVSDAAANTGAGGGTGAAIGRSGAGGSGICIIKYWA